MQSATLTQPNGKRQRTEKSTPNHQRTSTSASSLNDNRRVVVTGHLKQSQTSKSKRNDRKNKSKSNKSDFNNQAASNRGASNVRDGFWSQTGSTINTFWSQTVKFVNEKVRPAFKRRGDNHHKDNDFRGNSDQSFSRVVCKKAKKAVSTKKRNKNVDRGFRSSNTAKEVNFGYYI